VLRNSRPTKERQLWNFILAKVLYKDTSRTKSRGREKQVPIAQYHRLRKARAGLLHQHGDFFLLIH
jgi:hypothetical protein